jgi:NADH:ubiquinone oxidoreductase subunit 4 (subunit M)
MSPAVASGEFAMHQAEFAALAIFAALILWFGLFPAGLFEVIDQAFGTMATHGGAL